MTASSPARVPLPADREEFLQSDGDFAADDILPPAREGSTSLDVTPVRQASSTRPQLDALDDIVEISHDQIYRTPPGHHIPPPVPLPRGERTAMDPPRPFSFESVAPLPSQKVSAQAPQSLQSTPGQREPHSLNGTPNMQTHSSRISPVKTSPQTAPDAGQGPRFATSLPVSWLHQHAMRHYSCVLCHRFVSDAVLLNGKEGEDRLACRLCCRDACVTEESDHLTPLFRELPSFLCNAIRELSDIIGFNTIPNTATGTQSVPPTAKSATTLFGPSTPHNNSAYFQGTPDPLSGRKYVRAKRNVVGASGTAKQQSPDHRADGGSLNGIHPNLHPASRLATQKTSSVPSADAPYVVRQLSLGDAVLAPFQRQEQQARHSLLLEEGKSFSDLTKRIHTAFKALKRGSTKQLKIEADEKYEHQDYANAIELYTKAINQHDGSSKMSGLYGNRSAALFMRSRFEECIEDCLAAVQEDSNSKTKMLQRAAKAATYLGDLARALSYHERIESSAMDANLKIERERLARGASLYEEAKAAPTPVCAEENWRMLVAEFTDTIVFRHDLAECYMVQGKFEKASEALCKVPAENRTDTTTLLLAQSYYASGFEHFDKARELLSRKRDRPAEHNAFLDKLNRVDEGKQTGNSLFSKRDFGESVAAYTTAINADLTNGRILRILYCNRAAANKELGRYKEGIEDCTKAIELDVTFAKAYARRARCHQHLTDFPAAIADFKSALKFDPQDRDLLRELRACEAAQVQEAEKEKDHYYVLGIARNAVEKEIKQKYRELSLRYHPDKCVTKGELEKQEAERKFKLISEAYSVLSDPAKRREYDYKASAGAFGGGGADRFSRQNSYNDGAARYHHADPMGGNPFGGAKYGSGASSAAGYNRFGGGGAPRYGNAAHPPTGQSGGFF